MVGLCETGKGGGLCEGGRDGDPSLTSSSGQSSGRHVSYWMHF